MATEPPKQVEREPNPNKSNSEDFSEEEAEMLMKWGEDILSVLPEKADEAWEAWTNGIEVSFVAL